MRTGIRRRCVAALAAGALIPVIAACGSPGSAPQTAQAELTVTLDLGVPNAGPPQTWQVACPSTGHTGACARLVASKDAFTSPSPDLACTMIYGGPEVLTVTGTVGTRKVNYRTGRTNGCEIADYARDLALVTPFRPAGVTPTTHAAG
jgi:hypothetical protein